MKLGLIAMSGVRAHNEELTRLGLTLPGFVERNRVIASLPSLGLLTLAGMTPRDIELDYVEVADIRELPDLAGDFDAVAISSFSAQIGEAYTLADRYRAAGTPVILGGLHVTARPEEAPHWERLDQLASKRKRVLALRPTVERTKKFFDGRRATSRPKPTMMTACVN